MLLCSVSPPANESQVNVLLTCGLGFSSRPAPLNDSTGNLFNILTLYLSAPAYLAFKLTCVYASSSSRLTREPWCTAGLGQCYAMNELNESLTR